MMNLSVTPRVTKILGTAAQFTPVERLTLAKLLLDSLLTDEEDEQDWMKMSLAAFEKDWDNEEDAIYDNWRELYGLSTG
ncbi:MAG: hypothetical protein HUU38_00375 [Anaerolineales bacterium]|nr:hypothetical protein [Anaerolineales bacterium]